MAPSSGLLQLAQFCDSTGNKFGYDQFKNEWWRESSRDKWERINRAPRTNLQPVAAASNAARPPTHNVPILTSPVTSPTYAVTAGMAGLNLTDAKQPASISIGNAPPISQAGSSHYSQDRTAAGPASAPTPHQLTPQQELRRHNLEVHDNILRKPDSNPAALDSSFKRRKDPKAFFTYGKVFLASWTEQVGNDSESQASGITTTQYGIKVHTKVRRFVVIIEGQTNCVALPITTYSGRGVLKPWVRSDDHSIIYTGKHPPEPMVDENTGNIESGLLEYAIRVNPDDRTDALLESSRLDYSKLCTIAHTAAVKPFGVVHDHSLEHLRSQLLQVANRIKKGKRAESNVSAVSIPFPSSMINNATQRADVRSHIAALHYRPQPTYRSGYQAGPSHNRRLSSVNDPNVREEILEAIMQQKKCSRAVAEAMLDAEVANRRG